MLLQQLKELRKFKLINKVNRKGYPLHVEYFLTERGKKVLQAVEIMQEIGIVYMLETGKKDVLEKKDIYLYDGLLTKK